MKTEDEMSSEKLTPIKRNKQIEQEESDMLRRTIKILWLTRDIREGSWPFSGGVWNVLPSEFFGSLQLVDHNGTQFSTS